MAAKKAILCLWSDLYLGCPWLKGFKERRWNFFPSLRWHLTDLGNRYQLWWSTQERLCHECLLKANKIVMHSVHLKSHSLTKDFFLLDFIFLIVAITNWSEMDQIPDTVKTAAKKHNTQRMLLQNPCKLQIPLASEKLWTMHSMFHNIQWLEPGAFIFEATSLFFQHAHGAWPRQSNNHLNKQPACYLCCGAKQWILDLFASLAWEPLENSSLELNFLPHSKYMQF